MEQIHIDSSTQMFLGITVKNLMNRLATEIFFLVKLQICDLQRLWKGTPSQQFYREYRNVFQNNSCLKLAKNIC